MGSAHWRVAVGIGLSAALWLTACSDDGAADTAGQSTTSAQASREPTTTSSQPAPSTAELIASQLSTTLTNDPSSALSSESGITEEQARQGLPEGTQVEVLADSWAPAGAGRTGVIVINATTPSGAEGAFAALVQLEDQEWKILSTYDLVEEP